MRKTATVSPIPSSSPETPAEKQSNTSLDSVTSDSISQSINVPKIPAPPPPTAARESAASYGAVECMEALRNCGKFEAVESVASKVLQLEAKQVAEEKDSPLFDPIAHLTREEILETVSLTTL